MQISSPSRPEKRVLIVDDELEILSLFAAVLERDGWKVEKASNADEAMVLFSHNSFDLVTLDWSMPGIGGKELHHALSTGFGYGKRVASMLPPRLPPILIITGNYEEDEVQRMAFCERVVGIVRKPVSCETLSTLADDLWKWERQRAQQRKSKLGRASEQVFAHAILP